jgi:3D (Asp-Asp-Asp) domain-containing protein
MLGFSAFAETAFGATVAHQGVVVLVTGSGVTVSMGTVTFSIKGTVAVTGSGVTVSQNANGITFTISGSVIPTGSGLTVSDGAEEVNVITWPPIDPDVSMTWTNIDPL